MYYIDANIFIYAAIDNSDKGIWSRDVLQRVENNDISAITSSLTWDEFTYALLRKINRKVAEEYSSFLFDLNGLSFIPVDENIIKSAGYFFSHYKLKPRDAIHYATAYNTGVKNLISEDSDFESIPLMKRIWMEHTWS
ncbi:type II toxin-antitoxin system VapC family toxin [Methanospirillum purgamenti]|jgi:predicted nucleic acid-binding protein|uniref:Type II toxin-antitoxin system VapC family toxin n=1 Tax=Methanospirillum hungatei TaxID=2203 RepID=A0A8F5VN36_METHU|nr:type II toxin-antitoxin system VapC family toxin [Methanospirillum hungatei]QXO94778.1 type II toxin-antitoxin system VapC family toxin [Methanospirillum hungatei]